MDIDARKLVEITQAIDRKTKEAEKLEWEKNRLLDELKKLCIYDLEEPSAEAVLCMAKEKEAQAVELRRSIATIIAGVMEKYGYLLDKE